MIELRILREHHTTVIPDGEGVQRHKVTTDRLQYATMMKQDWDDRYTPVWEDVPIVEEYTEHVVTKKEMQKPIENPVVEKIPRGSVKIGGPRPYLRKHRGE